MNKFKKLLIILLFITSFTSCIQKKKLSCPTNNKYWWKKL